MSNEVRVHASAKDDLSKPLDDIRDKFSKLQAQGAKGFGIGVAAGATTFALNGIAGAADAAASAVVSFGLDSIAKASDLNETMSKAEVIFGKNSDAVEKWAETMAKAGGSSKTAALDAASGFAGLFKTVGLSIDQGTAMSEKLTQMGSDLASFFNTDVGTALDALKSGLNGEAEPLRQFNIFLSETAVASELAKEGVKKVGGQFTEAQKATARYALIMQQTSDAQGDFVRTSDGLANSQRITQAEIDNLQAEIGQKLLPVVKELSNFAANDLLPALEDTAAGFDAVGKAVQDNQRVISPLIDTLELLSGTYAHLHQDQQAQADGDKKAQAIADTANAAIAERVKQYQPYIDKLKGTASATKSVTSATGPAAKKVEDLADAAKDAKNRLDDMRGAIRSAADALNTQKRGHEETNLKIKDATLDIQGANAELKKLEAIKDPTRDQRKSMVELKLQILQDKDEITSLKADLAASGKVSMAVTDSWLKKVRDDGSEAGDAIHYLAGQLHNVGAPVGGGGGGGGSRPNEGGNGSHGRASGGPVLPGNTYTVGENGPETLVMGGTGGRVIPNSGQGGGGGHTFNITMNGVGSDVSAGAAHAYALAVADTITATLRQQRARQA